MAIVEPACMCTKPSAYVFWLLACCFCRIPKSGIWDVSDSFTYAWHLFPPTGLLHPALMWGFVSSLIRSCYAQSFHLIYLWEVCSLLKRNRGVILREKGGGEGTGKCEGGRNCLWDILYERRINENCFRALPTVFSVVLVNPGCRDVKGRFV